jgi:hypothetical protein
MIYCIIKTRKNNDIFIASLVAIEATTKDDKSIEILNREIIDIIKTDKGYLDLQAQISSKGWIEKL